MSMKQVFIKIHLLLLTISISVLRIESRCGFPELPFMSSSIESKEYYDEGEVIKVSCISGVIVSNDGVSTDGFMNMASLECINNTWNTASLRCSQVYNISSIDIHTSNQAESKFKQQEVNNLVDNNPTTCVSLKDEEKWILYMAEEKFVSHVALIATYMEDHVGSNSTNIKIKVSGDHHCSLEANSGRSSISSPIIFLIFKCPFDVLTDNVTIHLEANGHDLNICGVELFVINDEDCGKPELPLYTYANQIKIQNNTKIVEYICSKGYVQNTFKFKWDGIKPNFH